MSTCHINNLVDALLLAVERGHGAYFVADAEEVTLRSIVSDLLATRGVKAGDKSVSFGVAWMLAGVMGFFWNLFNLKGEPPVTRQMLRLIGKPFTVNIIQGLSGRICQAQDGRQRYGRATERDDRRYQDRRA